VTICVAGYLHKCASRNSSVQGTSNVSVPCNHNPDRQRTKENSDCLLRYLARGWCAGRLRKSGQTTNFVSRSNRQHEQCSKSIQLNTKKFANLKKAATPGRGGCRISWMRWCVWLSYFPSKKNIPGTLCRKESRNAGCCNLYSANAPKYSAV
jgi:hypothetical protein